MPKLDWIGKEAVVEHHQDVPYRLVHCNGKLSAGDADAGNLLVQGDNLEALKALLPYYAGKVNCVYIDPPYNSGNGGWIYSDRVNDPKICRWLGKVVGDESEDMCSHDKWLCMMYPRLRLLHNFLRPDGLIFVSINDREIHRLRTLMDDIFGGRNFYAMLTWISKTKPSNMGKALYNIQPNTEYVLAYGKKPMTKHSGFNLFPNEAKVYPETQNGKQCRFEEIVQRRNIGGLRRDTMVYGLLGIFPRKGYRWQLSQKMYKQLLGSEQLKLVKGKPFRVIFPDEEEQTSHFPFWSHLEEVGTSEEGKKYLSELIGYEHGFDTVKPVSLIERILFHATKKDGLILDSFAGSGTTGHAVLSLNKEDGGNRRFILVEMVDKICRKITARRLQTVIDGNAKNEKLDGGFRFCELGKPLFDEKGGIAKDVKFADLANHIFFSETGSPIPKRASGKTPFLGVFRGRAYYLLRNGARGGALTAAVLDALPTPPNAAERVIFGDNCRLSEARLKREKAVFRQIPYEIKIR